MLSMRGRVDQYRRLARMINDPQVAKVLLQMAEEVEADMARLQDEQACPEPNPQLPPQK